MNNILSLSIWQSDHIVSYYGDMTIHRINPISFKWSAPEQQPPSNRERLPPTPKEVPAPLRQANRCSNSTKDLPFHNSKHLQVNNNINSPVNSNNKDNSCSQSLHLLQT